MDWKRVIDNNITHASRTAENRYQQFYFFVVNFYVLSCDFKILYLIFMEYFCCMK